MLRTGIGAPFRLPKSNLRLSLQSWSLDLTQTGRESLGYLEKALQHSRRI
jgi:hypothetical protein